MPKSIRWAVVVTVLAVAISGCGGDDDDDGGGGGGGGNGESRSIYANYPGQEFPYYQAIKAGQEARAKELGWEFQADFANNVPEEQVSQIETALTRQPDGMLISPVTSDSVVPAVRRAKEQGVAVVAVANNIADPSLLISFTGTENATIGRLKAEFIVDKLGGKGRVGVIHGVRGRPFSEEQAEAADEVFAQNPGIEVVDGGYAGGFSSDVALDKTQTLLTRAGSLDALYYDNDDQALGGIKALESRNLLGDVIVVGTDGTPAALNAVKAGRLAYTISLCGYTQGEQAVDILADYLDNGKKPPAEVPAKIEEVTPEVVEDSARLADLREQKCE